MKNKQKLFLNTVSIPLSSAVSISAVWFIFLDKIRLLGVVWKIYYNAFLTEVDFSTQNILVDVDFSSPASPCVDVCGQLSFPLSVHVVYGWPIMK